MRFTGEYQKRTIQTSQNLLNRSAKDGLPGVLGTVAAGDHQQVSRQLFSQAQDRLGGVSRFHVHPDREVGSLIQNCLSGLFQTLVASIHLLLQRFNEKWTAQGRRRKMPGQGGGAAVQEMEFSAYSETPQSVLQQRLSKIRVSE